MEITEYSEVSTTKLLRSFKLIKRELGLKNVLYDPIDLLPRFISKLGLSHETLTKAIEIMNSIKGTKAYSGKNPKSIIAGSIYLAARLNNEKISQRDIANTIGLMEVTIRKRYKEISKIIRIRLN